MKLNSLLALSASAPLLASAIYIPAVPEQAVLHSQQTPPTEKFLVEFDAERREWITEDDKWELRRQGINFMVRTTI
jgi:leucyl aminopeptidase